MPADWWDEKCLSDWKTSVLSPFTEKVTEQCVETKEASVCKTCSQKILFSLCWIASLHRDIYELRLFSKAFVYAVATSVKYSFSVEFFNTKTNPKVLPLCRPSRRVRLSRSRGIAEDNSCRRCSIQKVGLVRSPLCWSESYTAQNHDRWEMCQDFWCPNTVVFVVLVR